MRTPRPLYLAIFFFAIAAALLALIATHKTKTAPLTTESSAIAVDDNFAKYVDEAEKQNELERDRKEQAEKLTKIAKAKKESVECQFWTQQKQNHSADKRVEEKISQFCELPQEEASPSLADG